MTLFRKNLGLNRAARRRLARFMRREDGTMTIYGCFLLMCILATVGIGVDVMRFEHERANLQYTLDRAVLAAADLDQPLPPAQVVADYFAKAGLSDALANVQVTETLGSRTVTAEANSDIFTYFMKYTGVDTLSVTSLSTAQEAIDAVEISLVLDVSGSMRNYSRLTNLKVAAKDFVDEMFDNSVENTVTISIVPYATQVTAPPELFDELNVQFDVGSSSGAEMAVEADMADYAVNHPHLRNGQVLSHCINWRSNDFRNTTISATDIYERTMTFDPWYDRDGRDDDPQMTLVPRPVCEAEASRQMMILENDRTALKNYIDDFFADGNTSLDIGMKWGSILIDPSFQPIAAELAKPEVGLIDPTFANRPVAHNDAETVKVIVLMTDGQNTSQYFIDEDYRVGESNIWWNEQEEIYSVYLGQDVDDDNENGLYNDPLYYWPFDDSYQDHAYGEGTYEDTETSWECRSYRRNGSCRRYRQVTTTVTVNEPGSAEVLTYQDLWTWTTLEWVVEDLYEPFMNDSEAWNDWYYAVRKYVGTSTKNSRTQNICNAAKDNGTIVYTIGFESPSSSRTLLQNCASSPAHFFDVEGLEISDAFSAIASSIRSLRLTQ